MNMMALLKHMNIPYNNATYQWEKMICIGKIHENGLTLCMSFMNNK